MRDFSTGTGPDGRQDAPATSPDPHSDNYIYSTETLFRGRGEITIRHEDNFYRLKITRQGKLILNK